MDTEVLALELVRRLNEAKAGSFRAESASPGDWRHVSSSASPPLRPVLTGAEVQSE